MAGDQISFALGRFMPVVMICAHRSGGNIATAAPAGGTQPSLCDGARADTMRLGLEHRSLGELASRGAGAPRINPVKIGEVDVGKTH